MWIIEKPSKFICGIYEKETKARMRLESLGSGYKLRKLKIRNFPFHIVETFEAGKRKFSFWQGTPEFEEGVECIDYHIDKPWEPVVPGADEMGRLSHAHRSYLPGE
jgi:hypothetical protein